MHSGEGLCIDMTTHNYRLKPLKGQQGQQTSIGKYYLLLVNKKLLAGNLRFV